MIKVILMLTFLSSVCISQNIEPGIWEADSNFEVNGLPLPSSKDQQCITKGEASDIKITLAKELEELGCTTTKWTVKGTQLEVALKCTTAGLKAFGTIKGRVLAKSYELSGEADGTYQGFPSSGTLNLKGKWLRNCP